MYLCYVDESGTTELTDNSTHFVLVGVSLPIWFWRTADQEVGAISKKYDLDGVEIHTAWMLRPYLEQRKIPNFESLAAADRRSAVSRARAAELIRLRKAKQSNTYNQTKKNFRKTEEYTHLTFQQRGEFIVDIATAISGWPHAGIFAECIDKMHFDANRAGKSIDEQAFEQIISRFERYIRRVGHNTNIKGVVVHDNNESVARKHTALMRKFHAEGTLWTSVDRIIETPMFVDSKLTRMVQMADLCSFAIRRYLEHKDPSLFNIIYKRADRIKSNVVGMRHFTNQNCSCMVCEGHKRWRDTLLVPI
jgi:hypothetical protein